MLLRLSPEEVSRDWRLIKHAIIYGMPPRNGKDIDMEKVASNVLTAIMAGVADVWLSHVDNKIHAVAVTVKSVDAVAEESALIIYSLYGCREMSRELWEEMLTGVRDYARAQGITVLSAFSDVPKVLEIASMLGFKRTNYLMLEV